MDTDKFQLIYEFEVSSDRLFRAWLNSDEHAAFTGGDASIVNEVSSPFTAWDGYIDGENLELEAGKRILQTWRTTDFPHNSEYSFLELLFEDTAQGCKLTLNHWNIPKGQGESYKEGWLEHYFLPMTAYFEKFGKSIE
jgi:activator of HSP90 ATPase